MGPCPLGMFHGEAYHSEEKQRIGGLSMADRTTLTDADIEAISDKLVEKLGERMPAEHSDFWIPAKDHYDAHQRIDKFFKMIDDMGNITRRVVVTAVVMLFLTAMAIGLCFKINK